MTEPRLYAEDVACKLDMSLRAAQRYLAALEVKYGAAVVGQERRRLGGRPRRYTTEHALAMLSPRESATGSERRLDDLEAQVASLGRQVEEIHRRLGAR